LKHSVSVVLVILCLLAGGAAAIPGAPAPVMTIGPDLVEVDVSAGPGTAVFNCTADVTGLPLVRYHLNLSAESGGWESVCSPKEATFTTTTNQSFTVTVTVPQGERGGTSRFVNVTATVSTGGIPISNSTASSMVTILQGFSFRLTSAVNALTVDAGKLVSWPFEIRNTGNGRDTFPVSLANLKSYTSAGWTVKFNRTQVPVEAGGVAPVLLNLTPPANLTNQTLTIQVSAYSQYAKYDNITVEQRIEYQLTVRAVPGGGNGTKPTPTPKGAPGAGSAGIAAAVALAFIVALRRRRRGNCPS